MVDSWIFALGVGATAVGGALGTGALVVFLQKNFAAREEELGEEISELRIKVNELQSQINSLSRTLADAVGRMSAPEVSASVSIGGNAAGRDSTAH